MIPWLPESILDAVDDYRTELKENGAVCEHTGKRVIACVHHVCPRCCLHCSRDFMKNELEKP